jgi:hypothetical protein
MQLALRPQFALRRARMLPLLGNTRLAWCAPIGFILTTIPAATGCGPERDCVASATCAPSLADANSDAALGDRDAPFDDAADASDARDVSANDRDAPSDANGAIDTNDVNDRRDSGMRDAADSSFVDRADPRDREGIDVVDDASNGSADVADGDGSFCMLDAGQSPAENPCLINERYGVFVSPTGSDATGAGTRSAPFRTIARALHAAKIETMRVFACDEGTGYPDAVALDATLDGVAMYGGFECSGWTYSTDRRARIQPATGTPLTIVGITSGILIDGFELRAADASTGANSVAVAVTSSAQIVLRRTKMIAGKGGAGASGIDGAAGMDGEPAGPLQRGLPAIYSLAPSQPGGIGAVSACGSKGGSGGGYDSTGSTWMTGFSGEPMTDVTPPNTSNGADDPISSIAGHRGSDGDPGRVGTPNSKQGTFKENGYSVPAPGGEGEDGHVAQGGGGGISVICDEVPSYLCSTGGAGGLGGCGGKKGTGGAAGGASLALFSWKSGVTLDQCELISSNGGAGGRGGNGGTGGKGNAGALGGDGLSDSDAGVSFPSSGSGGPGGNGGAGAPGAGGNGGPSYGIVYAGGRPSQIGGTTVLRGEGGVKGLGGNFPSSSAPDAGTPTPDAGGIDAGGADGGAPGPRAPDGLPGDAAYEFAVP